MPAPTPQRLFFSLLLVVVVLFARPPTTNFIFDEQEALLGNPLLQGSSSLSDIFVRDFWGRVPERTIGAYRPLPNLLWWSLGSSLSWNTPWVFTLLNLLLHAATGTLLALSVGKLIRRDEVDEKRQRFVIWMTGLSVVVGGVLSEAVCSAVGLADLLVGFFCVLFLFLTVSQKGEERLSTVGRLCLVSFGCALLGLLSKETMVQAVVLFPLVVWLVMRDRERTMRQWVAPCVSVLSVAGALLAFVGMRSVLFPAELADASHWPAWLSQPKMPVEPMNNPLFLAEGSMRLATAASLFARQATQLVAPIHVNGDYSYPAQLSESWSVVAATGLLLGGALIAGLVGVIGRVVQQRRPQSSLLFLALGLVWMAACYLPVSNSLILLPTIRAERLLYSAYLGVPFLVAALLLSRGMSQGRVLVGGVMGLLFFQGACARWHALRYADDVAFWRSAKNSRPASAKAHLNLGVMLGALGDEVARLRLTKEAVELAPDWPMGRIYLGDSLCRLKRLDEGWPHYRRGLDAKPDSKALTGLALQCLWDQGGFEERKHQLYDLSARYPGSWLSYFVNELVEHGKENGGIPPEYRPRKYNARASTNAEQP